MKNLILSMGLILLCSHLFSQELTRQYLGSGGQSSTKNKITLDWSLGQIVSTTVSVPSGFWTQGFQQPYLTKKTQEVKRTSNSTGTLDVWPNPTIDHLFVEYNSVEAQNLKFKLIDINGNQLNDLSIQVMATRYTIDIEKLQSGMYILQVYTNNGQLLETKRIIKIK